LALSDLVGREVADADVLAYIRAWTSCPYGQAIVNLVDDHHDQRSLLYPYPKAGHGVGSLVPYEPYGPATVAAEGPISFQADHEADAQLWPRLLGFPAGL
jgi:hypothetical protein